MTTDKGRQNSIYLNAMWFMKIKTLLFLFVVSLPALAQVQAGSIDDALEYRVDTDTSEENRAIATDVIEDEEEQIEFNEESERDVASGDQSGPQKSGVRFWKWDE